MTKLLSLSFLLLAGLTLSNNGFAQQPAAPAASANAKPGKMAKTPAPYKAADPATRAQKMTNRLTKQLGLDDATSKKVYDVALARDQAIDAIQTGSDDNKTKAKKLKANADDFKSKLQSILTPDQFAKFQQMKHGGKGGKGNNKAGTGDDQDTN